MTNTGTAAATSRGVAVTGDFPQTNTCGTSIAAGASCTVNVTLPARPRPAPGPAR